MKSRKLSMGIVVAAVAVLFLAESAQAVEGSAVAAAGHAVAAAGHAKAVGPGLRIPGQKRASPRPAVKQDQPGKQGAQDSMKEQPQYPQLG